MKRTILGVVLTGRDHAAEYRRRIEKDPDYFRRMAKIRWHEHDGGGQDRSYVGGYIPRHIATALEDEKRRRGTTGVSILIKALRKELFGK